MRLSPGVLRLTAVLFLGSSIAAWSACAPIYNPPNDPGGCEQQGGPLGPNEFVCVDTAPDHGVCEGVSGRCYLGNATYTDKEYSNVGDQCSDSSSCTPLPGYPKSANEQEAYDNGGSCGG